MTTSDTSSLLSPEPPQSPRNGLTPSPCRLRFSWSVFWSYTGPGWLMSMAYLDPGNLEADLQSGAYTRYQLLYVVLLSTALGGLYQVLAARLGASTGRHLAQLCRSEYPPVVTLGLWVMTELAIIGSDIQEVLGSAVAFELLFGLPLWLGCLLTGLDTLTFLGLHRAGAQGGRYLELLFLVLIATMCVCFFADFTMSHPDGVEIAKGVVEPRLDKQNTMQAVAMLGAIIMPHNIFLHSALVQERQIDNRSKEKVEEANFYFSLEAAMALFVSFLINAAVVCAFASSFFSTQCYELSSNPISSLYGRDIQTSCIPAKAAVSSGSAIYDAFSGDICVFGWDGVYGGDVTTGIMDMVKKCTPCYVDGRGDSVAMTAIGTSPTAGYCQEIGLAEAGEAVREALGGYAKVVWAIGLLASGQASTMTGTYAGQFVMEGFLDIRIAAWKRVALTRAVALVPAVIVALISQHRQFQSDRFNELLNVLQSVQLPFALLPLLAFTTSKRLMGPRFVNTRWMAALLVVGTALLCSVNYSLVYDILLKNLPDKLSPGVWIILVSIAGLYVALLLYLLLVYPSETSPSDHAVIPSKLVTPHPSIDESKRAESAEQPLLENEGVV
ncbi:hypothetical protein PF005_g24113 [Phytophthora fragariae]|uniref:Metal transporter n=1 Tax=Phytophthora fragariae TaxID=53985 RepID=A0A6A3QJE9_9STRA|nr:hypothetical protein PF003_g29924 [Phytophthora fragariae]KAE8925554.1 hypothetical protein PF009_g24236 [Phytophthora fragariae]KAE8979299.1 hypothetical protein PF011_g22906 [Phytophthora fragariae]KAE9076898.1 hypothetical protein PF007_g24448 [Phytophthora fragariae]KAE9098056.1 hypothetical protein PF006_g23434 [Phytophthora fragariae]